MVCSKGGPTGGSEMPAGLDQGSLCSVEAISRGTSHVVSGNVEYELVLTAKELDRR